MTPSPLVMNMDKMGLVYIMKAQQGSRMTYVMMCGYSLVMKVNILHRPLYASCCETPPGRFPHDPQSEQRSKHRLDTVDPSPVTRTAERFNARSHRSLTGHFQVSGKNRTGCCIKRRFSTNIE